MRRPPETGIRTPIPPLRPTSIIPPCAGGRSEWVKYVCNDSLYYCQGAAGTSYFLLV